MLIFRGEKLAKRLTQGCAACLILAADFFCVRIIVLAILRKARDAAFNLCEGT
jgi:hypothetical protein